LFWVEFELGAKAVSQGWYTGNMLIGTLGLLATKTVDRKFWPSSDGHLGLLGCWTNWTMAVLKQTAWVVHG